MTQRNYRRSLASYFTRIQMVFAVYSHGDHTPCTLVWLGIWLLVIGPTNLVGFEHA